MALYIPVIQTKFYLKRLLDEIKLAALMASGVLDMKPLDEIGQPSLKGDYVNIPAVSRPADFARFDYTSSTPQTGTAIFTNNQKFPMLWADSLNTYLDTDTARTGEDFAKLWSERVADVFSKRMLKQFGNMLAGATPSALTNDKTGQAPTVEMIRHTKYLAGDQADQYTTLVCHSDVWSAILRDMLEKYSANPSIAGVAFDGSTAAILGCDKVVISDQMPNTAGGATSLGDNLYSTFLLREGAVKLGYQMEPERSDLKVPYLPGNINYVKYQTSFTVGLEGTTWTGGANPDDSDLADPSNWAPAYSDLRDVSCTQLLSAGTLGGI